MCKISKETNEKINKLAKLFNAESGIIEKTACTGKYRGTSDYSIVFNNNVCFYISNGFKNFNYRLDDLINQYEKFNKNKNQIMEYLKNECELDKIEAIKNNLQSYKIIDVDYNKTDINGHLGWFYVVIELENGKKINMLETNLNCNIIKILNNDYENLRRRNKFFIAGGLRNNEVDYIFHNVGFSSINDMYKLKMVA